MENQENPILMLKQPLSMLGVIKETIKTIIRNRRPLQVILCLVILTNIQFQVATRYDLELLPIDNFSLHITFGSGGNRQYMRSNLNQVAHEQMMSKFHMLFTSCCLFLYCAIVTISCSYEAYAGNTLSIMDAVFKPSRNWKRPLLTSGCILLLTLGIYAVYIFSFTMISFWGRISHIDSFSLFYITALKLIFNALVGGLWMMSLVVTVLEDKMSGLKAINRAWDLMKGNRIQITLLMMLYYGTCLLARKMFDGFSKIFEEWVFEDMWSLKIPFTSVSEVFLFVLYAVVYQECKTEKKVDEIRYDDDTVSNKSS